MKRLPVLGAAFVAALLLWPATGSLAQSDTQQSQSESAADNSKDKPAVGKPSSTKSVDQVTLSETSKTQASASEVKIVTSEIRQELVNKFRDILQNGTYEVKANEIADKIVQKIRENKNSMIL